MQSVKAGQAKPFFRSNKSYLLAMMLVVLTVIGLYTYNTFRANKANSPLHGGTLISQKVLEENYGLGVNLVAVTAAGGMVDLRLKIIDGQKAKALLDDPANFPVLLVGNGVVLRASDDFARQEIKFENGGSIYALFSNARNIVKPGVPVTIVFGGLQVETVSAK